MPAELLLTPQDELTHLPLPLLPLNLNHEHEIRDRHHHAHPRRSPLLEGLGGTAVRHSRVQRTAYADHHWETQGYHSVFGGPELPQTAEEQFKWVTWASAGYIPEQAVAMTLDGYKRVMLSTQQRAQLWGNNEIWVASRGDVKSFMVDYLINQGYGELNVKRALEKFLKASDRGRKIELASFILSQLSERAVSPIHDSYKFARRQGFIHESKPRTSSRLVKRTVMSSRKSMNQVIGKLELNGAAYLQVA
ncbi:MAG: hypothetical protein JWS12_870 [Candidatus Saccharibacteria bacterium]|nr:hypothetical protein [Candidatus Saccharibacteria bacterium]